MVVLAMAIVLTAVLMSCAVGEGTLKVRVEGSNGVVSGAKVVSNNQPDGQLKVTGITGADGYVIFEAIKSGDYSFYVSVAGYAQKDFTVTVASGTRDITITLTPS